MDMDFYDFHIVKVNEFCIPPPQKKKKKNMLKQSWFSGGGIYIGRHLRSRRMLPYIYAHFPLEGRFKVTYVSAPNKNIPVPSRYRENIDIKDIFVFQYKCSTNFKTVCKIAIYSRIYRHHYSSVISIYIWPRYTLVLILSLALLSTRIADEVGNKLIHFRIVCKQPWKRHRNSSRNMIYYTKPTGQL